MLNIYDYIRNNDCYKTFKVDDLLFVKYECLYTDAVIPFWTHNNYFCYVLTGHSRYTCGDQEYPAEQGDAMFVRRGSYVVHRRGDEGFCSLLIFVPDEFIKTVLEKYPKLHVSRQENPLPNSMFSLNVDESLSAYFHSVLSYFSRDISPSPDLLKIKFEELLLNVMTSRSNQTLAACLGDIHKSGKVSLRNVMETSFMYNMNLDEYARLCGRSLSVFKTEFQEIFNMSPGKWLIRKRLQYSKLLIETTRESINDVAFKSGFKNTTHFVKVFKDTFGVSPLQYRLRKVEVPI